MFVFAAQDTVTKTLITDLSVWQLLMIRYWVFFIFVLVWLKMNGKFEGVFKSKNTTLQLTRSFLSILEIALFHLSLRFLGLAEAYSVYAVFPLITVLLAVPILGESFQIRHFISILLGLLGVLLILGPDIGLMSSGAIFVLLSAIFFSLYSLLTRKVCIQGDGFYTNLIYMAIVGALVSTVIGLWRWESIQHSHILGITVLCFSGMLSHLLLVKAIQLASAADLQPFNYTLIVFGVLFGYFVFNEIPSYSMTIGGCIIVFSGLYVFLLGRDKVS
jgi:drug/metabolite transporter (DMT)-like permease